MEERRAHETDWTADQLKEFILTLINSNNKSIDDRFSASQLATTTALSAAEKAVIAALQAADKATNKAELAADSRFNAVNEFRGQLADQVATFLPRNEYNLSAKNQDTLISGLTSRLDRLEVEGLRAIKDDDQRTSKGLQNRYISIYFAGAVILVVVTQVLIHFLPT